MAVAAAVASKAAKKNASRAAKRLAAQRASGRGGGRGGGYGWQGGSAADDSDSDTGDSGGSDRGAAPTSPARAAARSAPSGLGPTVHGHDTLLMEDDPRLRGHEAEDHGWAALYMAAWAVVQLACQPALCFSTACTPHLHLYTTCRLCCPTAMYSHTPAPSRPCSFGLAIPTTAVSVAAASALPFFTGDEDADDPYNQVRGV